MEYLIIFASCVDFIALIVIVCKFVFQKISIRNNILNLLAKSIVILVVSLLTITLFQGINAVIPSYKVNPIGYIVFYFIIPIVLTIVYFAKSKKSREQTIKDFDVLIENKFASSYNEFKEKMKNIQLKSYISLNQAISTSEKVISECSDLTARLKNVEAEMETIKEKYNSLVETVVHSDGVYVDEKSSVEIALSETDRMAGEEFELFCQKVLIANGFSDVNTTKATGDYGIDLLAEKDNITYAIQCKCYSSTVGNKAVQEAYSGKSYYNRMVACVLTNNFFTQSAIDTAKANNVVLWDRNKLQKMLSLYVSQTLNEKLKKFSI